MKTSSAKAKGRRCAAEVKAHILRVFKELDDDDIVITSSGTTGEDYTLSPRARALLPISPECKNVEALNIWKALEQAESNCRDYIPVLHFRRNRSKLYTALETGYFMEMAFKAAMYDKYMKEKV